MTTWGTTGSISICSTTRTRSRSTPKPPTCFKHPRLGIEDIRDVWAADPMFYPAKPPAHWLMVAEVEGTVLMVPLAPARDDNPKRCRPIGCYPASKHLADRYRSDR
jgi:hypothetical protein